MVRYRPKVISRIHSTRRMKKDLDRIQDDMKKEDEQVQKTGKPIKRKKDVDLPGLGQFYCIACDRHFQDTTAMETHNASGPHKRRLKRLKEEQHRGYEKIDNGMPSNKTAADVNMNQ